MLRLHKDRSPAGLEPTAPGLLLELLGNFFRFLDYPDLLRAERVCKTWQACIASVKSMQAALYKAAEPINGPNENPHFVELTAECLDFSIPGGLRVINNIQDLYADNWRDGVRPDERDEARRTGSVGLISPLRHQKEILYSAIGTSGSPKFLTWPLSLREAFCRCCEDFHPRLYWNHLHPVLRFMQHYDFCCIRSQGSGFWLHFNYRPISVRRLDLEHFTKIEEFCYALRKAAATVQRNHLDREMLTRLVCTYFLATHGEDAVTGYFSFTIRLRPSVHSSNGVAVMEAILVIARACHVTVQHFRRIVYEQCLAVVTQQRRWSWYIGKPKDIDLINEKYDRLAKALAGLW